MLRAASRSRGTSRSFLMTSLVLDFLVCEGQLFLNALNFIDELTLVECLLRHNLSLQVLDLGAETFLNCGVFFSHDFAPNAI